MKTKIIVLLLTLSGLMTVQAQKKGEEQVVNATGDLQFSSTVLTRNRLNRDGTLSEWAWKDVYCKFFTEGTIGIAGEDVGVGLSVTWMPSQVGPYFSWLTTEYYNIFNAGVSLRLFRFTEYTDWQLYGGISMSETAGVDFGLRVSATRNHWDSRFSWLSFTVGRTYVNEIRYTTIGLSIELLGCIGLWWIL